MTESLAPAAPADDRRFSLAARRRRRKAEAEAAASPGTGAWDSFRYFPRMLPFVRPHWRLSSAAFGMIGVGVLMGLAAPWPMAIVIDTVLGHKPLPGLLRPVLGGLSRYQLLAVVVAGGLTLTTVVHAIGIVDNYVTTKLNLNLVLDLRKTLYAHTQRLSLGFHDRIPTGQIAYRLGQQAGSIGQIIVSLPPLLQSAITILGTLVIALLIDWQLALLSLVVLPILVYATRVYAKRVEPRIYEVRELQSSSQSILLEGIQMMRVIVAFGRERHEFRRWGEQAEEANVALVRLTVRQTVYSLVIGTATAAGGALILGVGAVGVVQHRLTLGELVVLLGYIASIYSPLTSISSTFTSLQQQFINFESCLGVLDTPIEVTESPDAVALEKASGRVTYEGVDFTYPDTAYAVERRMRGPRKARTEIDPAVLAALPEKTTRRAREILSRPGMLGLYERARALGLDVEPLLSAAREPVLSEISFDVEPGQHVAVVGPTGAGKTTLLNLLMRFYDPTGGRVLLDGVDLRELTLASLREQITVVPQEPLLFGGTIADNIRYGKLGATDDEVEAAAKAANIHEFISRLPDDYETVVGERGAQLSGGERQRISVARAFLKDAPIVVLDEPTSSIDSQTESVILAALARLTEGRTTFTIAHRLSTIRRADLILVLERGRLVQRGTHDDLLREDGGLYRKLHDLQFGLATGSEQGGLDRTLPPVGPFMLLCADLLLPALESLLEQGSTDELRAFTDACAPQLESGSAWPVVGALLAVLQEGPAARAYTASEGVPWPMVHRFTSVVETLLADDRIRAVCDRLRESPRLAASEPLDPRLTMRAAWTQVAKVSPEAAEILGAHVPLEGPVAVAADRRRDGRARPAAAARA